MISALSWFWFPIEVPFSSLTGPRNLWLNPFWTMKLSFQHVDIIFDLLFILAQKGSPWKPLVFFMFKAFSERHMHTKGCLLLMSQPIPGPNHSLCSSRNAARKPTLPDRKITFGRPWRRLIFLGKIDYRPPRAFQLRVVSEIKGRQHLQKKSF